MKNLEHNNNNFNNILDDTASALPSQIASNAQQLADTATDIPTRTEQEPLKQTDPTVCSSAVKGRGYQTTRLVMVACMVALVFIFSRFLGVTTDVIHLGFDFLPVAVIACLYGPIWAAITYILGDLASAILVPMGVINPGITLMAGLIGLTLGLCLHSKERKTYTTGKLYLRTTIAALISCGGVKLFGTTACLAVAYGSPYWAMLVSRIPNCALLLAAMVITIPLIYKLVVLPMGKLLNRC